jgi:hypothetical protein
MGFDLYVIDDFTLNVGRGIVAGVHLVWAFILVILWGFAKKDDGSRQDLMYPLYDSFGSWTDSDIDSPAYITGSDCDVPKTLDFSAHQSVSPGFKDSGMKLSLHWIVVMFLVVSAFFQTTATTLCTNYYILPPTVRYIEYPITMPLMTVAIALQIGIMSTHTLLLLAVLSWVSMMCMLCNDKLVAALQNVTDKLKMIKNKIPVSQYQREVVTKDEMKKVVFITQTMGWAIIASIFYVLITAFHSSQKSCDSPGSAPRFVWAIVYGELVLFCTFGFMQILEMVHAIDEMQADMGYIILSFVSKTYLAWLVYGGNFVQA